MKLIIQLTCPIANLNRSPNLKIEGVIEDVYEADENLKFDQIPLVTKHVIITGPIYIRPTGIKFNSLTKSISQCVQ